MSFCHSRAGGNDNRLKPLLLSLKLTRMCEGGEMGCEDDRNSIMIGKLNGKIDAHYSDHLIIDVNGVGYLVFCSTKTLGKTQIGEHCQLFIETHVREEHIHLYGFLSLSEKFVFNLMQSVSGIGPRMAMNILSQLSPDDIELAISRRDKEIFRAISGVGPKLAERIIIELKDKFIKLSSNVDNNQFSKYEIAQDAVSALINLGMTKANAQHTVSEILSKNSELTIDELIKLALRNTNRLS